MKTTGKCCLGWQCKPLPRSSTVCLQSYLLVGWEATENQLLGCVSSAVSPKMDDLWKRDSNRVYEPYEGASAGLSVCVDSTLRNVLSSSNTTPTLSPTGSDYSSVQHSLRSRRPLTRLSSGNETSPQWDWNSAPVAVTERSEDEPAHELRNCTLPMSLKRALRYAAFTYSLMQSHIWLQEVCCPVKSGFFWVPVASTSGSVS